jgi:hypothetical protein
MSSNIHHKSSAGDQASLPTHCGSDKKDANEFHILPIDEDKKYPPAKDPSSGVSAQFPGVTPGGPALMPGPFISSMGTNPTTFEREYGSKAKRE